MQARWRSQDAFAVRRSQVILASVAENPPSEITITVGVCVQLVRNVIRSFDAGSVARHHSLPERGSDWQSVGREWNHLQPTLQSFSALICGLFAHGMGDAATHCNVADTGAIHPPTHYTPGCFPSISFGSHLLQ